MVRDELKDKEYFVKNVKTCSQLIEECIIELREKKIKKSQISDVSIGTFDLSYSKFFCMYSGGYTKEEMKESFFQTLELIQAKDNDWEYEFEGEIFPFYMRKLLVILSIAILLDMPKDKVENIIKLIDTIPIRYKILDYYISYFDSTRKIGKAQDNEYAFKELIKMTEMSNEEILSKKMMDKYLKKWYKVRDRVEAHGTHNNGLDSYGGYWSFESAAFVKMRGLDDSSFRDNVYYPKDLL